MWHPKHQKKFWTHFCLFLAIFYVFLWRFRLYLWKMAHDRFDECHSFNMLGLIQLLYDTTCVNSDFWVKPVWGLGVVLDLWRCENNRYFILKFRSWLSGASNIIILSSYTCFHWPLKLSTNGDCDPIKFVMLHLCFNVIYCFI